MEPARGLRPLALAAAVATFLLLTAGGFVTSLDAGMVYRTWPLSDGSLNPEGWTRDSDKLSEHGHRLLGGIVGLLTIALALRQQAREPRRSVRILGWVAVPAVCLQGLLGGLRVTEVSTPLAMLHGCTGQLFLCLMVALAYLQSRDATGEVEAGPDARSLALGAAGAFFAVFMQVVLGARLRHVGGPLDNHLLGAVLVVGLTLWLLTSALLRHAGRPAIVRPVLFMALLVLLQAGLGLATADALKTYRPNQPTPAQVLFASSHQVVGAMLLATTLLVALRAVRRAGLGAFRRHGVKEAAA
jgi:cytochrome c oxidase assembly protein subunit 15